MNDYEKINSIELPYDSIKQVYGHLRACGHHGVEGVALLAGVQEEYIFEVKTAIIPEQNAYNHEEGLIYTVSGEELHRINVWLYKNKLTLIAQVHSHPNEAYHSPTDDRYPIITAIGGFSIVVPYFGFNPITVEDWAVFRLNFSKTWQELSTKETKGFIKII